MTVKELAIKYYPRLWDDSRIRTLVIAGKLSVEDYEEITGEYYYS